MYLKILSECSNNCLDQAYKLYSRIFSNIYKSSSLEEAEFIGVARNTFRLVNISLVNSLRNAIRQTQFKNF